MIRYRLNLLDGVIVSLDADGPNKYALLQFEGPPDMVPIARDWLANQYGAYGHSIGEETTPVDLAAAMIKNPCYAPQLLEGEDLLVFDPGIPPGAVT